ncbi:hypothetical protein P7D22_15200 [Lichenihabitans sp. Uapishka_5]|uniref:hypothetical protein n=1 Tax=Lichenihabitans sp. Uapishka_5 TaxID=3037302 RepID=UPI0029E806A5|nr:hypothetical protein [Lichenihabitans sp. Uapishka_5]MDX7952515.1 hypothetical protein [Lichenihabitans sp. Uapishka_5]
MGTIVNFPSPRRKRRLSIPPQDEATILLFMGVRYVRELDPAPERPQITVPDRQAAVLESA